MIKKGWYVILLICVFIILIFPVNAITECKEMHITNRNTEKALDITFLTDGEVDYAAAERQIKDLVSYMGDVPPFNEFIDSKINIRYVRTDTVNDLQCCSNEGKALITDFSDCNHIRSSELASYCPTDEIVVFSARGDEEFSCNQRGGIAAPGQQAGVYESVGGEDIREVSWLILHELGHSMAFLADEYIYEDVFDDTAERERIFKGPLSFVNAPNCAKESTCEKWRNVPGTSCVPGCSFDDWYRPTESGMMYDDELTLPNPVAEMQFRSAMNRYVDYVKEPMSIEIRDTTLDFIMNKFIQNNPKLSAIGIVPDTGFREDIEISSFLEDEFVTTLTNMIISGLVSPLEGIQFYNCHDYWVQGEGNPKFLVKFKDFQAKYQSPGTIQLTIQTDVVVQGKASLNARGSILYILSPNGVIKEEDCTDLIDIDWNTNIPSVPIIASLHFTNGPLGIVKVRPQVDYIGLPEKAKVNFEMDDAKLELLKLTKNALNVIDLNHYTKSYNFLSEIRSDTYSIEDELNANLNEFGLSLKTSLDALGLEQLANMGKPHGMILDFYMENYYSRAGKTLANGIEVDETENSLRLSGPVSFNTPLFYNRAECVKSGQLNFNPIDYTSFNKDISDNPDVFASIQLSQSFQNWFIATLWNDGYFCAEKEIPVADNPEFLPNIEEFVLTKAEYEIIPLSPPYIDYTTLEDTNGDDIVDINHDIVSQGRARMNLVFEYKIGEQVREESIPILFSYIIPLQLEEPDLTMPKEKGFTPAQSFFKTDVESTLVKIESISCESGVICDSIKLSRYKEPLIQEIKENMASHADRASADIAANSIRDVDLDFGNDIAKEFFNPPLNLNYGKYIAKVTNREINGKYSTYDFNLVEKCASNEDCGSPGRARIKEIQEIYYKDVSCENIPYSEASGEGCKCIKKPTEESKVCIDAFLASKGKTHYYVRIDYAPTKANDLVTYNFNLINWNRYKTDPGVYTIYLTDTIETYNRLSKSRQDQTGDIEYVDKNSNIHTFSIDATQIIAFRERTQKGVEQGFKECMAAVIIDRAEDMVDYHLQGVLVKVKPRLRSDVNEDYIVCTLDTDPEGYATLLSSTDYISTR